MTDDDTPATLEESARVEQEQLWSDLDNAVRFAHNGSWSVQCDNLAWRITNLAAFVGATSWGQVSVTLLRSGVYERILTEAGRPYEPIDWDAVERTEAYIAGLIPLSEIAKESR